MSRILARLFAGTAAMLTLLFSFSVVATAAVVVPMDDAPPGEVADGAPLLLTIYEPYWTLIVTLILPSLVAWITDRFASSVVKTWVMIALAGLTSLLAEFPVLGGGVTFDLVDLLERWFVLVLTTMFGTYLLARKAGLAGPESKIAASGLSLGAPARNVHGTG